MYSYTHPGDIGEALAALTAGYRPYAGGTDLMVRLRGVAGQRHVRPFCFIGHIAELRTINRAGNGINIGSLTTMAELASNRDVPPLLSQACLAVGSPGLRNVATLGGNICTASPAGDTLPVLYLHEARVLLRSSRGERSLPINKFISGPGKTVLAEDELLVSVFVPDVIVTQYSFKKVSSRVANAISKISLAATLLLDDQQCITDIRLAYGAVGPTVIRCHGLEQFLLGKTREEVCLLLEQCEHYIHESIQPIDDQRSSVLYRREVACNLFNDFTASEDNDSSPSSQFSQ